MPLTRGYLRKKGKILPASAHTAMQLKALAVTQTHETAVEVSALQTSWLVTVQATSGQE